LEIFTVNNPLVETYITHNALSPHRAVVLKEFQRHSENSFGMSVEAEFESCGEGFFGTGEGLVGIPGQQPAHPHFNAGFLAERYHP
jgi:hypothetical protein